VKIERCIIKLWRFGI